MMSKLVSSIPAKLPSSEATGKPFPWTASYTYLSTATRVRKERCHTVAREGFVLLLTKHAEEDPDLAPRCGVRHACQGHHQVPQ